MFNGFPKPVPDVGGGAGIKSIQQGTGSIAAGVDSVNIPISTIDLNKSIVLVNSYNNSDGTTPSTQISLRAVITSPANIQLIRATPTQSAGYSWTVIEFMSVKSLQKGAKTLSTIGSITVAVSAVNVSKSLLFYSHSNGSGSASAIHAVMGAITNSTTLSFSHMSAANPIVEWQLVELN